MDKTLEELRAENAAAEAANAQVPQTGANDADDAAANDLNDADDHADDQDDEDGAKAEPESWMKGDDQESHGAEKKFTDKDIGAAKARLRSKLDETKSELEQLRQQLEDERRKNVVQQPSAKPKRDDFYDQDDPDEAYTEALADWKVKDALGRQHSETQQYEFQRKQLEAQQAIETGVDQHYERAAKLAAASGISPELYQSADLRVRSAIDGVFPGGGEQVTNSLIACLGEGSEKVFYNLGVSPKRLAELVSKLQADPSGLQASTFLGRLSAELTAPVRRTSNAPAPATTVQGDANTSEVGKGLHRKYQEAHKKGDTQAAFNIRREAKAKQINTQTW